MAFERTKGAARTAADNLSGLRDYSKGLWSDLGRHGLGRTIQTGLAQEIGYHRVAGGGLEFLGGAFKKTYEVNVNTGGIKAMKGFARIGANLGTKSAVGSIGKIGMSALPMLGPVLGAVLGYQNGGGITGAIGGVAESAAISVGWEMAMGAGAFVPFAIGAAGVAAAGYGFYQFGEAAQRHGRKQRKLEMGGGVSDTYGHVSTLRQRSLQALQNTHVNGRMAIGNEASIMHKSMF